MSMRRLHLDDITKDQATEYANNEADLKGFKVGSTKWKDAFKRHLSYAVSTMSLGRNPRTTMKRNPRDMKVWPEIYGEDGFAGAVHKNFKTKSGERIPLNEARDRIKGCITNLTYMMVNAVYNIKTTTKGNRQGKIPEGDMSDLQLRGTSETVDGDEKDALNKDVLYNQLALTTVETICQMLLVPFFKMKQSDIQAILDSISVEGKINAKDIAAERTRLEAQLRRVMEEKLRDIDVRKIILG